MRAAWALGGALSLGIGAAHAAGLEIEDQPNEAPVYPTFGVHNPPEYTDACAAPDCLVQRGPDAPSDPLLPLTWVSDWIMYRVFRGYEHHPPPYASPPEGLVEGEDYAVSHGTTYYNSTYRDENGTGAMMEFYRDHCLPIFPRDANYTCAFISLGNIAYFLSYEEDRPEGMPPCCRFSNLNHPPRRDFVKHLPWSAGRSAMNGWAADLISQDVADRVGKVWGLGSDTPKDPGPWEGEQRNMWKPTQQEALWFHGGNLHQSRHYSQFLALQLKARMESIPTPVYGLQTVHHLS